MAFNTRKQQDILFGIIEELRRTGINYLPSGSKARALADTLSKEIDTAYKFFDSNFDKAFLSNATDEFLEALGMIFNVNRKLARKAISPGSEQNITFYVTGNRTFGEINSGSSITIPVGTIIETPTVALEQEAIRYQLTSTVVLSPSVYIGFATAEALLEGRSSNVGTNSLVIHDFTTYTDLVNDSLKVTNRYAVLSGNDRENDALYRARISLAAQALQRGNLSAIRFSLLAIPGIVDTVILPYFDGIGSVGAFILGSDNEVSPLLLNYAQNALDDFSSAGEVVTAYSPNRVGVEFTTHINLTREITVNEQVEIERALSNTINPYITSLRIGNLLDLQDLARRLNRSHPLILNLGTTPGVSQFDEVYMYRYSDASGERVRQQLLNTVTTIEIEAHEIIISEPSISSPYTFTFDPIE